MDDPEALRDLDPFAALDDGLLRLLELPQPRGEFLDLQVEHHQRPSVVRALSERRTVQTRPQRTRPPQQSQKRRDSTQSRMGQTFSLGVLV